MRSNEQSVKKHFDAGPGSAPNLAEVLPSRMLLGFRDIPQEAQRFNAARLNCRPTL
jgi:hypothetical protein